MESVDLDVAPRNFAIVHLGCDDGMGFMEQGFVGEITVSHCVGLRVYDLGFIPSLTHSRLVRTRLSAHNASRRRYRTQFP
jgi:hypothetical protein